MTAVSKDHLPLHEQACFQPSVNIRVRTLDHKAAVSLPAAVERNVGILDRECRIHVLYPID